jgi:uncharacterized protein
MHRSEFKVKFGQTSLVGDVLYGPEAATPIFLHGAGTAERRRFDPLRDYIAEKGFGSVAFDFIGHGETGGDLKLSSLKERVAETEAVISELKIREPLSLVGMSMGAYVAIKITELFQVTNLILTVPGVYTREAYTIPFGDGFTEMIRSPESWNNSDAWEILGKFKGNLLVFVAGQDTVIPTAIIEKIDSSASEAESKEIVTFDEAPHRILKYFAENPSEASIASEKIIALLKA